MCQIAVRFFKQLGLGTGRGVLWPQGNSGVMVGI
jgi:hypothetical protein